MLLTGRPDSSGLAPSGDRRAVVAQSVLDLTQRVFSASTLLLGVRSVLEYLVVHTAAVGAVYIQVGGGQERTYHVRATWGEVP